MTKDEDVQLVLCRMGIVHPDSRQPPKPLNDVGKGDIDRFIKEMITYWKSVEKDESMYCLLKDPSAIRLTRDYGYFKSGLYKKCTTKQAVDMLWYVYNTDDQVRKNLCEQLKWKHEKPKANFTIVEM